MPILMARGQGVGGVGWGLMGAGVAAGLVWRILRWPKVLDSVMEADRQLGWDELLSTAWRVEGREGFAGAVVGMAEAKCAQVSYSSVVMNKLGARAWGGIGLAGALVVTLGFLGAQPLESQVLAGAGDRMARRPSGALLASVAPIPTGKAQSKAGAGIAADFPNQEDRALDGGRRTAEVKELGRGQENTERANPEGVGPGAGSSNSTNPAGDLLAGGVKGSDGGKNGVETGSGSPSNTPGTPLKPGGNRVGTPPVLRAAPPWSGGAWEGSRAEAEAAIRAGGVPGLYQDLVRDYFGRPGR